ncbi:MAG: PspC domain-containing protein [Actinomycetota bacterium]|nr:PspC domain-containing protein [Actinomycetota bacterium]
MSSQKTTTPPPAASRIRRLTRRRDNKMIAGVCSGLADYTGLDPIIFRIIFIALVFAGGSGLLLYGLAWIFVPEVGSSRAHGRDLLDRFETTPWLGAALLIAGGVLLLGQINVFSPPVRWGIVLLILGVVLFREQGSGSNRGPRPAVPVRHPYEPAPPASSADAATTAVLPPAVVAAPRPPRERSALGWYTVAATLMALGIAALLDASNSIHVTLVQYLALPLAVIGAGLIVGAWLGRSRLLIVLGVLLVPFVLTASLIHVPLTGAAGTFVYRPQSSVDIPPSYHIAAGDLTLDLTRLALGSGSTDVTATVGAGQLRVLVPFRVPVTVDGRADIGGVTVFGRTHGGTEVHVQKSSSASRPGLNLHLHAGLGAVRIERVVANRTAFPVPVQPAFP